MLLLLPLFPEAASTVAPQVDHFFIFMVSISAAMSILIFLCIIYFAVKYREGSKADRTLSHRSALPLEIAWTAIPFGIFLFMFAWGVRIFYKERHPPAGSVQVFVVGKQWMWKIQHPEGKREINELHVPAGQPVKLMMTSEDVIHDFFVPAFRVKQDVVPGRYETMWFEATKTGQYHLFCSQYCGTNHAQMRGYVTVMEPADFQKWLASGPPTESMAATGARLYESLNCGSCHKPGGRGPDLTGLYGKTIALQEGGSALADEAYIRESILTPNSKVTAGYRPLMPTYQGQLTESQVLELIAYIKSLGTARTGKANP
jgi:cytochrome c oxidase subunit 2